MLFNSATYAIFLPIIFGVYWLVPQRAQNLILLGASYVFYAKFDWRFLSLIWAASTVSYIAGQALTWDLGRVRRKVIVIVAIAAQLAILGTFKYFDFFAGSLEDILSAAGLTASFTTLNVILPIGISFFTFQAIGYVIDVHRRDIEPERDILRFYVFIAFFPQLVAGPIERAKNLLPQFRKTRQPSREQWVDGFRQILWGIILKMVIADRMDPIVRHGFDDVGSASGWVIMISTYAFALQIYADFAGYSNIALGSARLFGIELMQNFRTPYFSMSPREFWRRWHISLSTWFRDYVYIPLGGNRLGRTRTGVNIMATFLVSGLWHGAAWTFPIWGAVHGGYQLLPWGRQASAAEERRLLPSVGRVLLMVATFNAVAIPWIFFRANSLHDAGVALSRLPQIPGDVINVALGRADIIASDLATLLLAGGAVILVEWTTRAYAHPLKIITRWPTPARWLTYYAIVFAFFQWASLGNKPFIYFQF